MLGVFILNGSIVLQLDGMGPLYLKESLTP